MNIEITKHIVMKFIELLLTCILLILLFHASWGYKFEHDFLASGTYLGFLIILAGLLGGGIIGAPVDQRIDLFFSLVGCGLFIAVGAIYLQEPYKYYNKDNKTMAIFSIINGIVFLVDAALVVIDEMK